MTLRVILRYQKEMQHGSQLVPS